DSLPRRCLDVHHQLRRVGEQGGHTRPKALGLSQVDRPCRLVEVPEARAVFQQLALLPGRQIGKALGARRTPEGEEAVAINSRESHKDLVQLLAAHALYRIAPKAVHRSEGAHVLDSLLIMSDGAYGIGRINAYQGLSDLR